MKLIKPIKTIGVLRSIKPNEHRIPIHPDHLKLIPNWIRKKLYFERGYGEDFSVGDGFFSKNAAGVASRDALLKNSDLILDLKPIYDDLLRMKKNAILWGWVHCVQNKKLTQAAIDRKLTLIAFEGMYYWSNEICRQVHVFNRNNEIAGSTGVTEALRIAGYAPSYGMPMKAIVLGFGAVGRGAVRGLKHVGIHDITVFTEREIHIIPNRMEGVVYKQMVLHKNQNIYEVNEQGTNGLLFDKLKKVDVIVNTVVQNALDPRVFVYDKQLHDLKRGTIIVDISIDRGMGFEFAKPTSFKHPIRHRDGCIYYAVDHIPSCVWHTSSFEISQDLLPFLPILLDRKNESENAITIEKAIEIQNGEILNPVILKAQNRDQEYPHRCRTVFRSD